VEEDITKQSYATYSERVAERVAERLKREEELKRLPDVLAAKVAEQIGAPADAITLFGMKEGEPARYQNEYFVRFGQLEFVMAISFGYADFRIEQQMIATHQGIAVVVFSDNANGVSVEGPVDTSNANYDKVAETIAKMFLSRLDTKLKTERY
jgi:hypothetical protein